MNNHLTAAKSVARHPYAWPGGYPKFLLLRDGACLCATCARTEFRQIARAYITRDYTGGWYPDSEQINWETPDLTCDNCGATIQSAYGEE